MTYHSGISWDTVRIIDEPNPGFEDMDLLYAEFADEEFIHFEIDESGQSIMWSTADDLTDFLEKVRRIVGPTSADGELGSRATFKDGTLLEDTPERVEREVLSRAAEVSTYQGGYDEFIIAWTRPKVKMKTGKVPHSEAAVSSRDIGRERLTALLSQTATSRVVDAVQKDRTPLAARIR